MSAQERFLAKISIDPVTNCWNWTAAVHPESGYGVFRVGGRGSKTRYAHRVSWMLYRGFPGSLFVLHSCDNRKCVNPDHLFLGTHQDNMDDMVVKGRSK